MSNTPNPDAAAEIESVSHGHMAEVVAHAPHGSNEESSSAPLPESYPYRTRIRRNDYETQKARLQIELLKAQNWVKETGRSIVVLFEAATPPARAAPSSASWST
jgi:polyphosphate kinase 2 (PPK2 family)